VALVLFAVAYRIRRSPLHKPRYDDVTQDRT
jgi:hypothetical protein